MYMRRTLALAYVWLLHVCRSFIKLMMSKMVLLCCRVPQVESVYLNMPNLHFLPCNPVTSKVRLCRYWATVPCMAAAPTAILAGLIWHWTYRVRAYVAV